MHVHAVADDLRGDIVTLEHRADQPGPAVAERGHAVEQVCGVCRAGRDAGAGLFVGRARMAEGDAVEDGQTVATIEAMKMEASITAHRAGTVSRLAIGTVQQVEGGDLLLELS